MLVAFAAPAHAQSCQFVGGFKVLHDRIPEVVGSCLEDEVRGPYLAAQPTMNGWLGQVPNGRLWFVSDGLEWRMETGAHGGNYVLLEGERLPWDADAAGSVVVTDMDLYGGEWWWSATARQKWLATRQLY